MLGCFFLLDLIQNCRQPVHRLDGFFRYILVPMPEDPSVQRFQANLKRLPVHLQAPFEGLKRQQAKIKRLLSTKAGQEAFLKDPVTALEGAGVKIDSALRKVLLGGQAKLRSLRAGETATFANGTSVTPKVRLKITT